MYKAGDLVVLIANRYNSGDSLSKPYTGHNQHLKGKILKVKYVCEGEIWEYCLDKGDGIGLMVNSDQIVPARIAKTEIYKALTGDSHDS